MKRLAIIGAGDLGQQIAYHALNDHHYQPIGFFDDYIDTKKIISSLPILGRLDDVHSLYNKSKFDVIMIALGYQYLDLKESIFNRFKKDIPFGSIIHSSSFIDRSCNLGAGIFIYPGCVLDMNVTVKDNAIMNVGCTIAHDSIIGENSFLSPSVNIAGFVKIGQKVWLGIGTSIIDNINVVNCTRTGAGAVVIKNIEKPGLYVGVPAIYKKN